MKWLALALALALVACGKAGPRPAPTPAPPPKRPSPPPPQSQIADAGAPATDGAAILAVIRTMAPGAKACMRRALQLDPDLSGDPRFELTIAVDGQVSDARAPGLTPEYAQCMVEIARKLRFAPQSAPVRISFPFH